MALGQRLCVGCFKLMRHHEFQVWPRVRSAFWRMTSNRLLLLWGSPKNFQIVLFREFYTLLIINISPLNPWNWNRKYGFFNLVFCLERILRVQISFFSCSTFEIPLFLVLWKVTWAGEGRMWPLLAIRSCDLPAESTSGCLDHAAPST